MISHVIPRTAARQTPLSMDFSRQEYWSGLPFPSSFSSIFYSTNFLPLSVFLHIDVSMFPVSWNPLTFLTARFAGGYLAVGSWGAPVCFFNHCSQSPFSWLIASGLLSHYVSGRIGPGAEPPGDNTGSVTTKGGKEPLTWNVPDFTEEESEQTRLVSFSLLLKTSGSE